ncbi:hypothetical protein PQX77_012819 [Marasmius sp. AFHP31]|nr:hypothetical protein PQX77_012819 [Marasmius sp. AFHP31]
MAQPVFDDHPLGQYLREAGETSGLMPGGTPELLGEEEEEEGISLEDLEEVERLVEEFLESMRTAFSSQSFSAFTEKFKYNVISSSLLSSSLTTTTTTSHASRPTPDHIIPGNLSSRGHSRSSSASTSASTETNNQEQQQHLKPTHSLISSSQYLIFSVATALLTILFGAGYYCSSVSIGAVLLYIFKNSSASTFMTPTLDTLNDLIVAGNVWDSVVQEVMIKLEKDEKHMIYSSNTPTSPRSSLRVALHSTLLTTQNQSDNVRQLLSALASQSELSQISYMYAPPSPVPSRNPSSSSPASRPFSLPTRTRRRTISNPKLQLHPGMTPADKRATWNGSYAFLADAGSPTMQILKRREKRRSDLTALLHTTTGKSSFSAPVTPSKSTPGSPELLGVTEEETETETELAYLNDDTEEESDGDSLGGSGGDSFGMAALELQRKRKLGGMQTLTALPTRLNRRRSWNRGGGWGESYSTTATPGSVPHPSHPHSPRSPIGIGHSASRYTGIQAPRHPLSLSALRQALQGALSSKRYACSHLLALRFGREERDDEVYWEDVRSVMGLLTTTLADASVRLTEALEEVERMRLQDEQPTPAFGGMRVLLDSDGEGEGEGEGEEGKGDGIFGKQQQGGKHRRTKSKLALSSSSIGFAPMPSRVARFAAHVDAISTALEDAREQLEQCVASLRKEEEEESRGHEEDDSHPALQAYERLRRELGLALRECERGREHLTDVVHPPRVDHSDEEEDDDDEHADLPGLGHDGSDDLDDKPEPAEHEHHHQSHPEPEVTVVNAADGNLDDVTSHLLFTATTEHLPPPGIEQVYEGDSGNVGVFKREKSKLSREERIALVKKARESGKRLSDLGIQLPVMMDEHCESAPKMERWGPGGEVVQELKDVIWKVGERRRKMTDGLGHVGPPLLRPGDVR